MNRKCSKKWGKPKLQDKFMIYDSGLEGNNWTLVVNMQSRRTGSVTFRTVFAQTVAESVDSPYSRRKPSRFHGERQQEETVDE